MKRLIVTLTLLVVAGISSFAQDIKEGSAEINGITHFAVVANYSMPFDVVEGTILKKMADAKFSKPSKSKEGFKIYKGVNISDIQNATMDYYIKVDDKKPNATLTMMVSKGYDNFLKRETGDSTTIEQVKIYLTKFMTDLTAYQLNQEIIAQHDVIKGIEKNMKNAANDEESLIKDKTKLESKISGNEIEIQALKLDMEAQQANLEKVKLEKATVDQMSALKKKVTKQENATKKVTKKYESALEDAGSYKDDLQKTENALNDNATEQLKIKAELEKANNNLADLKSQLANLK